jgi:hypothetical protein
VKCASALPRNARMHRILASGREGVECTKHDADRNHAVSNVRRLASCLGDGEGALMVTRNNKILSKRSAWPCRGRGQTKR